MNPRIAPAKWRINREVASGYPPEADLSLKAKPTENMSFADANDITSSALELCGNGEF